MKIDPIHRLAVPLLVALATALAAVAPAAAQQNNAPEPLADIDDVSGGTTTIDLFSGFSSLVERAGVNLDAAGAAELQQGTLTLPITGGDLTVYRPGTVRPFVQGELRHAGGLRLQATDTRMITLGDIRIDPDRSRITGDISISGLTIADDVPLFTLDGRTLERMRPRAEGITLNGATVRLSEEGASVLNAVLSTDALSAGMRVGTARIDVRSG